MSFLFPLASPAPGETGGAIGDADGDGPSRASHAPSSLIGDGPLQSSRPTYPIDPAYPVSPGASPGPAGPVDLAQRPRTRSDCLAGPRPCPWIGCKWHLCWERRALRRLILSQADPALVAARILDMEQTCVLDYAEAPRSDREVGAVLGVSHQAVAQTCQRGLTKLRAKQIFRRGQDEVLGADAPPAWRWGGEGGGGTGGAGPDGSDSGGDGE